jgi:transcriptional regulator with XRE-family HTH domain
VPGRRRSLSDAELRGEQLTRQVGREIREARLAAGVSQGDLARAAAISQSRISRIERSVGRDATLVELSRVASFVGLKLWIKCFPALDGMRDAAQLRLLDGFSKRLAPRVSWRTEVPMPMPGDLRAVDGLATMPGCRIVVEAWMRLSDLQAQTRAAELKRRDLRADRLVILLADTPHNRRMLRASERAIRQSFPLGTRAILSAMADGRDPGADGVVLLRVPPRPGKPADQIHAVADSKVEGAPFPATPQSASV